MAIVPSLTGFTVPNILQSTRAANQSALPLLPPPPTFLNLHPLRSHPQQRAPINVLHTPHTAHIMTSSQSSSVSTPLPSPVSPTSLSMETPSLGSHDLLPRPKRGAPPIAPPPSTKKDKKKEQKKKEEEKKKGLNPALCEGW
ncbi:hypothetical protein C8R46DRAFT_1222360 [Mycena filopes]|nr:hypothetical protein C8R46DRAFT_1222360 [Mycena filopes]